MRSKAMSNKKLVIRIITTPYKAICKAKDFYVRSITNCASNTNYGGAASFQFSRSGSSSSFASKDEDLRDLIRANSTARMRDLNLSRGHLDLYINHSTATATASRRVPRSVSVGMGRIDEDAPVSSFPDVEDLGRKVKSDHLVFPRSKSHAVTSTTAKINRFS